FNALQGSEGGSRDGFVAHFNPNASLSYLTYLGGTGDDELRGVGLGPTGDAYVAGFTTSSMTFSGGALQPDNAGGTDAFIQRIAPRPGTPALVSISSDTGASSTDLITTDRTLILYGTAPASTSVTLYREGTGEVGTTSANTLGYWSYDYTGTTLPE